MRIYLPATLELLVGVRSGAGGRTTLDLEPTRAHTVTAALAAALADEDQEGLEYAAHLAAADDALTELVRAPGAPRLRLVLTLEVPDDVVVDAAGDAAILTPSAVDLVAPVPGARLVCAHVDEPGAAADVVATLEGDDAALERLVERDLLWYDATELADIPR
ncbi:DUF6912 family protein [Sanguibacter sp. A247]|uniref:DUF6912 family protein n=1 Tax=unclassified Sanguibacter TaxID=2645534 RepID=UPI003FD7FDC8